jgi:gas vesicle protein
MARKHEHDEDDEVVYVEKGGSPIIPFLWGAAVGAALALLLAPTSGAELRETLANRARHLKDLAVDKAGDLEEQVGHSYERARAKVEEELDSARRFVGDTRHAAHDVVQAGKATAATAREELERRLADAREARRAGHADPLEEDHGE